MIDGYEKHTCTECETMFTSNEELQQHHIIDHGLIIENSIEWTDVQPEDKVEETDNGFISNGKKITFSDEDKSIAESYLTETAKLQRVMVASEQRLKLARDEIKASEAETNAFYEQFLGESNGQDFSSGAGTIKPLDTPKFKYSKNKKLADTINTKGYNPNPNAGLYDNKQFKEGGDHLEDPLAKEDFEVSFYSGESRASEGSKASIYDTKEDHNEDSAWNLHSWDIDTGNGMRCGVCGIFEMYNGYNRKPTGESKASEIEYNQFGWDNWKCNYCGAFGKLADGAVKHYDETGHPNILPTGESKANEDDDYEYGFIPKVSGFGEDKDKNLPIKDHTHNFTSGYQHSNGIDYIWQCSDSGCGATKNQDLYMESKASEYGYDDVMDSVDKNMGSDRYNKLKSMVDSMSPSSRQEFVKRTLSLSPDSNGVTQFEILRSLGFSEDELVGESKASESYTPDTQLFWDEQGGGGIMSQEEWGEKFYELDLKYVGLAKDNGYDFDENGQLITESKASEWKSDESLKADWDDSDYEEKYSWLKDLGVEDAFKYANMTLYELPEPVWKIVNEDYVKGFKQMTNESYQPDQKDVVETSEEKIISRKLGNVPVGQIARELVLWDNMSAEEAEKMVSETEPNDNDITAQSLFNKKYSELNNNELAEMELYDV